VRKKREKFYKEITVRNVFTEFMRNLRPVTDTRKYLKPGIYQKSYCIFVFFQKKKNKKNLNAPLLN